MALAASGLYEYNLSLNLLSVHQIHSPCQLAHLRVAVTYRPQENKSPMIVSVRQTDKDHTPLGNKKTGLFKCAAGSFTLSAIFMFVCSNLVDPEDHSILQIKGQLLGGTKGGEALDRSHHFLNADHLHCVGHHQGIDHGHVSTLGWGKEKHKISLDFPPVSNTIKINRRQRS